MKLIYIVPILSLAFFATSCSTDNDDDAVVNEVAGLVKIQDIANSNHTIELFNQSGVFHTGYNAISIRIKDNVTNAYLENASVSWNPMMQMPNMQHSCPKSAISKAAGKNTVYEGFIIYQMTNLDGSGWSLTLNYSIDGVDYSETKTIMVMPSEKQNVTSFMGIDNSRYIIAMMAPNAPKIAINKFEVGLFKMETMMSFPEVENYKITLDPRMPGMGNHSSPNNTDLTFNAADGMYHGNLSLTMTGYWVLNLKLLNAQNEVLKGESVTDTNEKSSLYLELEF
tara:strand:- start:11721 stop:12566 length:846 start_codon:yes stop_codon:yes gene_type:complete